MNITKERQELLDHFDEMMKGLGVWIGPGGCYECAAIRSLIESSGDKEQETDPFLSNLYGVKSAPSPAPTIKKDLTVGVEEAMDTARKAIESLPTNSLCVTLRDMGLDALAIIQAALRPKVVSREWIRKRADWAGCLGVTDVAGILRELGIEVSEGEMR